jgi:hypothetical protein
MIHLRTGGSGGNAGAGKFDVEQVCFLVGLGFLGK